jgi:seryl-tRNA synthetase
MLEKVHALQEQVAAIKAKKMDITALEESLKKLETELKAKEEKLNELKMKFESAPAEVTVVKKIGEDEAKGDVVVYKKIRGEKIEAEAAEDGFVVEDEANAMVKVIGKDDGMIQIVLTGKEGDAGRKSYELALAKLKKDLPEGFKLTESNFDEKSGEMTFKIASPEGKKSDGKLVQKLVELLRPDTKKK